MEKETPSLQKPARTGGLRTLWRCLGYLGRYWPLVAGAYLSMLCIDAFAMVNPQLIRLIVDRGIGGRDPRLLGLLVLALLGLTLGKGVLNFLQGRWVETASQGVAFDLRNDLHRTLSSLSFAYHDQAEAGQLLSRAVQDVDRMRFLTGRVIIRILEGIVMMTATTAMLLVMNPRLAVLAFLCLPPLVFVAIRFGSRFRPISREIQNQLAVLTSRIEQNLRGMRIVKAFSQEPEEIRRFDAENGKWFDLSMKATRIQSVNAPLLILLANSASVFILWFGGRMVISGDLTVGALVAFLTYLGQLIQPVRMLGMIAPAVGQSLAAADRVFDILDTESEVREDPGAVPLPDPPRGEVEFRDVSFSYFGRFQVLSGISFRADAGRVVALLGATGSGKSTVINLIPRFYDATGGAVLIDGRDVRTLTLASLRAAVGIVLQETTLFATTVRENIRFGIPDAREEDVLRAAEQAQAHEFIAAMPQGYGTEVGEKGVTLSGGQKQRLAIARALLMNPRILILDDATSSVDAGTEHLIQKALENLMHNRTTFLIAHRLSSIRRADLILVLEGGRIAARGTHAELLTTSALYADIFENQILKEKG